jgi:hypothetical protein
MTRARRLYFLSEGSPATEFAHKNPSSSAGFEPANFESNGKHYNHLLYKYLLGGTAQHYDNIHLCTVSVFCKTKNTEFSDGWLPVTSSNLHYASVPHAFPSWNTAKDCNGLHPGALNPRPEGRIRPTDVSSAARLHF